MKIFGGDSKIFLFLFLFSLFGGLLGKGLHYVYESKSKIKKTGFKGWEIYSWAEENGGEDAYSLLVGTNRLKIKDEITSFKINLDTLLEKLSELKSEEHVSFSQFASSEFVPQLNMNAKIKIEQVCQSQKLNCSLD